MKYAAIAGIAAPAQGGSSVASQQKSSWQHDEKQQDVRRQNISAARGMLGVSIPAFTLTMSSIVSR